MAFLTIFFIPNLVSAGTTTVFDLQFTDGLAPAGWSVAGTATWDFALQYARTTTNNNAGWYYKQINETSSNILSFAAKLTYASTAYVYIGDSTGDPDDGSHIPNGNGIALQCGTGTSGLWQSISNTTYRTIPISNCAADTVLRVDRNSSNGWTLYVNNVATGWYTDSNIISDFDYAQFYLDNGTAANKIDDFNFTETPIDNNTVRFNFYDENSGLSLNNVQTNFDGNDYNSGTNSYQDLNVLNLVTGTYTATFTKTNYCTRTYQSDFNSINSIVLNFAMLPSTLCGEVPMKVYQTDETTLFANTFVELKEQDTNYIVGKSKTNASGEATFNLKLADLNYLINIDNGTYTYYPVALTVLYPKNEETLLEIDENWRIDITQNLYSSFTELNSSKIIYLLPNTASAFNVKIQDMNGNYFARTYAKQYPGNPLTDTLQPYLVSTATGLLTTVNTVNSLNLLPVSSINIKIYKFISGLGRTYVEEITTDDKGQSLILLVLNDDYEFEIYQSGSFLRTDTINATSNTIYVKIPITIGDRNFTYYSIDTNFLPKRSRLITSDANLRQTTTLHNYGTSTATFNTIKIWATNTDRNGIAGNDLNLYIRIFNSPANPFVNNIGINTTTKKVDGNSYDTNGLLKVYVLVTASDGNTQLTTYTYSLPNPRSLYEGLSVDVKGFFGCSSTDPLTPCPGLLLIALFLSIIFTIGLAIETGYGSMEAMGIMFLVFMGLFTFFEYVPYLLYGIMIVTFIVIEIAIGGNKI